MKPFSAIENAIEEGDIENLNPKLVAASLLSGGKMGITLSEKTVDRYEIDRLPFSIFEPVSQETFWQLTLLQTNLLFGRAWLSGCLHVSKVVLVPSLGDGMRIVAYQVERGRLGLGHLGSGLWSFISESFPKRNGGAGLKCGLKYGRPFYRANESSVSWAIILKRKGALVLRAGASFGLN